MIRAGTDQLSSPHERQGRIHEHVLLKCSLNPAEDLNGLLYQPEVQAQ